MIIFTNDKSTKFCQASLRIKTFTRTEKVVPFFLFFCLTVYITITTATADQWRISARRRRRPLTKRTSTGLLRKPVGVSSLTSHKWIRFFLSELLSGCVFRFFRPPKHSVSGTSGLEKAYHCCCRQAAKLHGLCVPYRV